MENQNQDKIQTPTTFGTVLARMPWFHFLPSFKSAFSSSSLQRIPKLLPLSTFLSLFLLDSEFISQRS